jgi:hypothetical protein
VRCVTLKWMLLPGPRIAAVVKRGGALPVLAVLCGQALLQFHNLDLLPVWGDELFTLRTVARPVSEIIPIVQRDIHPPLYFLLLHEWMRLPLPWTGIAALRAFSVVAALLSTFLLDRLWLRRWKTGRRSLALLLFAFSPCLLLYSRMARSYTLQAALGLLAVSFLWRWMREPSRIARRALPAFAAAVLLLYTHYLPGIAILAGFSLVAWRRLGVARVALFGAAAAAAYAPWLVTLAEALRAWGEAAAFQSHYALNRSPSVEQLLKMAAAAVSLTIGESFSVFSLALVPVALLLVWRGCRVRRPLLPFLLLAAAIGYAGAARWVAWPFVAARLLWLLPFVAAALAIGITRRATPLRHAAALAIGITRRATPLRHAAAPTIGITRRATPLRHAAALAIGITRRATPLRHAAALAIGITRRATPLRHAAALAIGITRRGTPLRHAAALAIGITRRGTPLRHAAALAIGITRRATPLRHAAAAALLISFASSAVLYFRRENFVNLAYTAPLREIAVRIKAEASPRDVVLVDGYNADPEALRFYLNTVPLSNVIAETVPAARRAALGSQAVWVVRNTRDVSPGHLVSALEAAACQARAQSQTLYEPYQQWERLAIRIATGGPAPEYFYQLTVCR